MKRSSVVLVILAAWAVGACNRQATRTADAQATAPPAAAAPAGTPAPAEAPAPGVAGTTAPAPAAATSHAVPSPAPVPVAAEPAPPTPTAKPSEPAPTPEPTPRPRVLASGTVFEIELQRALSTKTARAEDPVVAELAADVRLDGDVVLPAGSEVRGHVVSAQRSGRVSGRARLVVAFKEVHAAGRTFAIDATGFDITAGSSKGKDAKIAGGAAAAGILIGAIADGGSGAAKGGLIGGAAGGAAVLATRGVEVELPAGARYKIELRKGLHLD
jgi:hypothetical protein